MPRPRLFPDSFRGEFASIIQGDITEERTATLLKCSPRTIRNYLKRWKLTFPKNPPIESGCVAKYLRDNPGQGISLSVAETMRQTGCSRKAVEVYFNRRRLKTVKLFQGIDLRKESLILRDNKGIRIRSAWIKSYTGTRVQDPNYIEIEALLKDNKTYIFRLRKEDLL